jgi:DNA-binding transcriptional regulator GbsR (MarR family)
VDPGRRAAELRYVEDVGLLMETQGMPRMAGRILGWLWICDPPEQSANDLAEVLRASKGSISTMTTLLTRANLIERVALPGHRRDYYRARPDGVSYLVRDGMRVITAMREVLDRGLALVAHQPPALRERLTDWRDVMAFMEREYPALLDHWEQRRRERAGQSQDNAGAAAQTSPPGPLSRGRGGTPAGRTP